MTDKFLTIVIPVYCEEDNLPGLVSRLNLAIDTMQDLKCCYIFVNDGSTDNSWDCIEKLVRNSSGIVGIDLSRNFGKEAALSAGVHHAKDSDGVICIDADLQHPPELIPTLVEKWREGWDIVEAIRETTEGERILRKFGSRLYHWLMSYAADMSVTSKTTDFRLYDRKVIDAFKSTPNTRHMFRGTMDWMGFHRAKVSFSADARTGGKSGFSYGKLTHLALSSIISFSIKPLKLIGYLGLTIVSVSGALLLWMLISIVMLSNPVYSPLAIVVIINTLLIGIVLVAIGLNSLYVAAIHNEVIDRPDYLIRNVVSSGTIEPEEISPPNPRAN
jgi:dolichol-phosphate mannosyltransferase